MTSTEHYTKIDKRGVQIIGAIFSICLIFMIMGGGYFYNDTLSMGKSTTKNVIENTLKNLHKDYSFHKKTLENIVSHPSTINMLESIIDTSSKKYNSYISYMTHFAKENGFDEISFVKYDDGQYRLYKEERLYDSEILCSLDIPIVSIHRKEIALLKSKFRVNTDPFYHVDSKSFFTTLNLELRPLTKVNNRDSLKNSLLSSFKDRGMENKIEYFFDENFFWGKTIFKLNDSYMIVYASVNKSELFLPVKKYIYLCILFLVCLSFVMFMLRNTFVNVNEFTHQIETWSKNVLEGKFLEVNVKPTYSKASKVVNNCSRISKKLQSVVDYVRKISIGAIPEQFNDKANVEPFKSINATMMRMRELLSQLEVITEGRYEQVIPVVSKDDVFGKTFVAMVEKLQKVTLVNEQNNRIKMAQTELGVLMRGDKEIESLTREIITFLSKFIGAVAGAFYIVDSKKQHLNLQGTFLVKNKKELKTTILPGEGLVGEVYINMDILSIDNIPQEYLHIESGLGKINPTMIVGVPVIFQNIIFGVMEFALLREVTDEELAFFDEINESIALFIKSTQESAHTKFLLDKTQNQANILQEQQEELRAQNEELEARAQELSSSEKRLRFQQEELQISNEKLEEKTYYLQTQKRKIEKANKQLADTQEELEKKAEALSLSSKYKSEFLANMSHELRTPLNSMLILAKNLAKNKQKNLTEKQVQYAETIHKSGNDLLNLINDILDLSKVESGKMEVYNEDVKISDVMTYCERLFQHVVDEKGLSLVFEIDENMPLSIKTDFTKLMQILKNFISNSIKFTEKGSVTISAVWVDNCRCISKIFKGQEGIAFTVTDTGIGIPEEHMEHIFEAFQQADGGTTRKYGGTGLGLSISREFTQLLQGELVVCSIVGEGSTFGVILPIDCFVSKNNSHSDIGSLQDVIDETLKSLSVNEQFLDVRRTVDEKKSMSNNIVLIEANPVFTERAKTLIEERGYVCIHGKTGEEGLYLCKQKKPAGILLDISLPDMGGWKVLDILRGDESIHKIPIHILSGVDNSKKNQQEDFIRFINYPFNPNNFKMIIDDVTTDSSSVPTEYLVVTSNSIIMKSICTLLDNNHTTVVSSDTGRLALSKSMRQKFDCIVLDLGLVDITGMEFLEEIKKDGVNNDTPLIIYTENELRDDEKEYLDSYIISHKKNDENFEEHLMDDIALFLHTLQDQNPATKSEKKLRLKQEYHNLSGLTIAIIDDDVRSVYALAEELEDLGISVIKVFKGSEALTILQVREDIDIVLTDVNQLDISGVDLIEVIRNSSKNSDVPIIALSEEESKVQNCFYTGVNDYLIKPVDIEELLLVVKQWVGKSEKI